MKLYGCTKLIRISRDGSKPDQYFYLNVRPAEGTLEEYLAPAAEYLAKVMANESFRKEVPHERQSRELERP